MKNIKETFRIYLIYFFLFVFGIGFFYVIKSNDLGIADVFNPEIIFDVLLISFLASFIMTIGKIKIDHIVQNKFGI